MPDLGQGRIADQVIRVPVSALLAADSPRDAGENEEHVETLAAAGAGLPPIIVHRATMRVIDGLHRLKAARLRGEDSIEVRYFEGDEADAFVVAVKANIAHGLPLSLADRKRAAARIIGTHPHWSDRMIASVTGLAPATLAELRRRITGVSGSEDVRVGQDGRVRPISSAAGRRRAGELITENPALSLRQVARLAGISPETVRDVRNRLARGEDPVPAPRRSGGSGTRQNDVPARPVPIERPAAPDPLMIVDRLRSDPALRFSEAGRDLLRLLGLHMLRPEQWNRIVNGVPPHCGPIVAELARACSDKWSELAVRVETQMAEIS
ncbi:ParB N-terminal domain-containing protein [Spirillospora sp. NPDC052269]